MIYHLKANYKHNMARMNMPYNINEPFESIIKQIETVVDFANAGKVPYMPEQVATIASNLIFAMGYFTNACRRWNQRPLERNTWDNFKLYFAEEHHVWQKKLHTSAEATYPSDSALVEANSREAKNIDAISLIAKTTSRNRDTYTNLYGTVASLIAELVIANKNLVEALK